MPFAVYITCNDNYVAKAITALKLFQKHHPNYNAYIIGTYFSEKSEQITNKYNINLKTVDLTQDFPFFDKRPHGKKYPIECFYHFYGYKILNNYDYIINIEPDIYINQPLELNFNKIKFVAGAFKPGFPVSKFRSVMKDLDKIEVEFGKANIKQPKFLSGFRVYNVKNLKCVNFYEKIIRFYKKSWEIGCPRCGDDSLTVLYQMYNPKHFKFLNYTYNVIFMTLDISMVKYIYNYHFAGKKYWQNARPTSAIEKYFKDRYIEFIYNNFELEFIKEYFPALCINIPKTVTCTPKPKPKPKPKKRPTRWNRMNSKCVKRQPNIIALG